MRQRCAEEVDRTTTDLVLAGMPTSRVRGTPRGRAWRYCGGNSGACGDSRAPNRHLRRPNVGITSWMPTRGLRTGETRSRANLAVRSQMGVDVQRHTQRTHGRPIHTVRPTPVDRRVARESRAFRPARRGHAPRSLPVVPTLGWLEMQLADVSLPSPMNAVPLRQVIRQAERLTTGAEGSWRFKRCGSW